MQISVEMAGLKELHTLTHVHTHVHTTESMLSKML